MRRPEVEGFISIAPPANLYDFSFLAPCPSSGLIVHGEKDAVVPPKDVNTLVEKLKTQKGIVIDQQIIPGANHFFDGKLEPLMETVTGYLDMRLANVRVTMRQDGLAKPSPRYEDGGLRCANPPTTTPARTSAPRSRSAQARSRDLHRAQRLAEQQDAHGQGADRTDAGPHRVGDADFQHLQRPPEQEDERRQQNSETMLQPRRV